MGTPKEYGQAEFPPVEMMPEIVFDAGGGSPEPAGGFGKAEFVHAVMLPEIDFDASNAIDADPVFLAARQAEFVMMISFPPGSDAGQVAADVKPLLLALRDYEIHLGGEGLRFEEEDSPAGSIAFRVAAVKLEGAAGRLGKLRQALTAEAPTVELMRTRQVLRDHEFEIALQP
jgi:hypothetical protein